MSKPLIPLKGGDEQDMLSPWRKVLKCADRPGMAKKAKRSYNKRVRRDLSLSDAEFAEELEHSEVEDSIPGTINQDPDDWDQEDWEFLIRRNDYK